MADATETIDPVKKTLSDSRIAIRDIVAELNEVLLSAPMSGRELAIAKTKLQEARMWIGQAQLAEGFVEPLGD